MDRRVAAKLPSSGKAFVDLAQIERPAALSSADGQIIDSSESWRDLFGEGVARVDEVIRPLRLARGVNYREIARAVGHFAFSCVLPSALDGFESPGHEMLVISSLVSQLDLHLLFSAGDGSGGTTNGHQPTQYHRNGAKPVRPRLQAVPKQQDDRAEAHGLTARELEVIALLAKDFNGPRAAASLGIAEATLQTHVRNAMNKVGTNTRTGLVGYALSCGLVKN